MIGTDQFISLAMMSFQIPSPIPSYYATPVQALKIDFPPKKHKHCGFVALSRRLTSQTVAQPVQGSTVLFIFQEKSLFLQFHLVPLMAQNFTSRLN